MSGKRLESRENVFNWVSKYPHKQIVTVCKRLQVANLFFWCLYAAELAENTFQTKTAH